MIWVLLYAAAGCATSAAAVTMVRVQTRNDPDAIMFNRTIGTYHHERHEPQYSTYTMFAIEAWVLWPVALVILGVMLFVHKVIEHADAQSTDQPSPRR